jgi:HEPN domain-containing protein
VELAPPLGLDESLRRELAILDQYYIPTRYPNGLPGGLPFEVYTADQAAGAVATCDRLITLARSKLPKE